MNEYQKVINKWTMKGKNGAPDEWSFDYSRAALELGDALVNAVDDLNTLRAENARLRELVYHTGPGEYSPDGWTWKQQANADSARLAEALAHIKALEDAAIRVLSGTGDKLDAMCILERTVYGGRSER